MDVLNTRLHLDQAIDSKAVSLIDIRVSENPPRDIELQVLPLLDNRQNNIGRLLILHDITERKQNELRNQSILQTAMDGFWLADTRGHLLEVNESYCRMSGYSEQELLAMSISDLETNETPEEMASHIEKIMTQGEDRFESRHCRKDDSFFDTEVSVQYQPGDGGRFIVFLHDITVRKQSEELLKEYLHKLGERAKELNCLYSISEIVKRNDISQAEALLECLPVIAQAHQFPEITGCRITLGEYLYSMENFAETTWSQNCAIMIRGEQAGSIEVCYLEERPLVNESPFLFEERALLKTVTNILGKYILRMQVEEALRIEHWRLESIIEATNVGTWEWNIQTDELVWNEAGAKIFGYTLKELEPISNKTWNMLAHPIDLEQGNKLLKRHFAGELPSYDFECRMKHKDGHWVWVHDLGRVMTRNADGKPLTMFGSITDISERKQSILLLEKIAKTDFLTNLYNRRYFMQRGTEECKRTSRSYQPLTLLMLDIDHFKKVNDTYGHEIGDLALQHVTAIMKSGLREIDILGRMGGEEFAALLPNTSLDHAVLLAERIRLSVGNTPFDTSAQALTLTVSIGVEMFTNEMSGIDELLRNADAALYRAKNSGRNCVVAYPSP
ncbi:MAG: diguanylate cyclase [Chloroflexi bacterium]|nr:diguanylate cyclase [Chloroflexota bacterium]